jgi:outer membrane lipoprotein-sorting protein
MRFVLFTFAIGLMAASGAAQESDPWAVLEASIKPLLQLKTYRADVGVCYADPGKPCEEVRRVVKAAGPFDRRIEQYAPSPELTIFAQGKARHYSPDLREYIEGPALEHVQPVEITSLQRLARVEILSARFLKDEVLTLRGTAYSCRVVEAKSRLGVGPVVTVRVFIDGDGFPRRMITAGDTKIVTGTIFSLDADAPIAAADFAWPTGGVLVQSFSILPRSIPPAGR